MLFIKNEELLVDRINTLFVKAEDAFNQLDGEIKQLQPGELFCNGDTIKKEIQEFSTIYLSDSKKNLQRITFDFKPQPSFNKQFDLLIEELQSNEADGISNIIACSNEQQAKRFKDIFDDVDQEIQYKTIVLPLYQGFSSKEHQIACYTDHQIFERYHKFHLKMGMLKNKPSP